jgi:hypothetical protein
MPYSIAPKNGFNHYKKTTFNAVLDYINGTKHLVLFNYSSFLNDINVVVLK